MIPVACCSADDAPVSKQEQDCKKRNGVKEEKPRVKQYVLIACIDAPVKKISFQRSCFSWFPADERQNYSANSESIGPDYFSSAEVGKMSAGREKTESSV